MTTQWTIIGARWLPGYSHEDHLAYPSLFASLVQSAEHKTFRSLQSALAWAEKYIRRNGEGDIRFCAGLEITVRDSNGRTRWISA